jgi:hypothetical protein
MKDHESAFPVIENRYGYDGEVLGIECTDQGISLKQYAAIHLKVPCSGDPELDAAIRESRRAEFAKAAIAVFFDATTSMTRMAQDARNCLAFADVMLAEWEKEAGK